MKNNETIKELKAENMERDAMIDALQLLMERQKWYMVRMKDKDGNDRMDENGNEMWDLPDADSCDFNYFCGYQRAIDAIYKALTK